MIQLIASIIRRSFSQRAKPLVHSPATVEMAYNMNQLLNKERAQEIIANVDNFLFDCDGVIWDGNGPIEGSLDTLMKLKKLGKRVFYATNNSSSSRVAYLQKCKRYGLPAVEEDIVCTSYVAAQYLKSINFKGKVYLIGKEEALGKELTDVGIKYIGPGPDPIPSTQVEDWLQTKLDPEVNCVLVGFDPHFNYFKILKAASYLKDPNCMFIITNEDWCLPEKSRMAIPGTGCITTPVRLASQRVPAIMGKPEKNMFDILSKSHNLELSRTMMVGDRYETDLKFGETCGMKYTFLVLTGVDKKEDLDSGKSRATFYAPCLGDLGKFL